MLWQVLQDPARGCSSYIVRDEAVWQVAVIDPLGKLGAERYVLEAQDMGAEITAIVETHVHADHLSCAQDLAKAVHAPHMLAVGAPARYPFSPPKDGDTMKFGNVDLQVWETPGHTPDSLTLLAVDHARGEEPWCALTGDSLFVGDVGRPDLADAHASAIRAAAAERFRSVLRFLWLPDFTEIHPAHYGSSPCGGLFMSKKPSSTVGYERRYNRFLNEDSLAAFVEATVRLVRPPPEDAEKLRRSNLGGDPQ